MAENPLQHLLSKLPSFEKHGSYFLAKCPAHADDKASLSIGQGEEGKLLINCHAGCKTEDILRALGLEWKNLFHDSGNETRKGKGKILAAYDYQDAQGNLLFQTVRYFPKDFLQRRPDPRKKGSWIWNLQGIERVIYRLPEVLKAEQVFIVEGEKDADNLARLGLTATTCPMGAGKWNDEWNNLFKGKSVIILPDNDESGQDHVTRIVKHLPTFCRSVKILELPDLPPKGDVTDWLANGGSKENLLQLVKGCPEFKPRSDGSESKAESNFCFEDAILPDSKLLSLEIPEKRHYLFPWLLENSIISITGWRGVGKSLFILGALDAITKRQPFGPWQCGEPANCLIVDGEMAVQDCQQRISDLGTTGRQANLLVYSDAYAYSLGLSRASLLDEAWRNGLGEYMLKNSVRLWVCDNIASLTPGIDENSKESWDPINQWLLELRFSGITTIFLHHENKIGGQRGTSAREDNLDVCVSLKRPPDYAADQGARFIVNFTKSRLPLEHLPLIADHEFQFSRMAGDTYEWIWCSAKKKGRETILRLIDEGIPQNDIATQCGVTKGRISQVKSEAIREGLMTKKGKLTQMGFTSIYGDEN